MGTGRRWVLRCGGPGWLPSAGPGGGQRRTGQGRAGQGRGQGKGRQGKARQANAFLIGGARAMLGWLLLLAADGSDLLLVYPSPSQQPVLCRRRVAGPEPCPLNCFGLLLSPDVPDTLLLHPTRTCIGPRPGLLQPPITTPCAALTSADTTKPTPSLTTPPPPRTHTRARTHARTIQALCPHPPILGRRMSTPL